MSPKIALLIHGPLSVVGGVERYNRYLIELLKSMRYEVDVFDPSQIKVSACMNRLAAPLVQYHEVAKPLLGRLDSYRAVITTGYTGGCLRGANVINICFGTVQSLRRNLLNTGNWKLRLTNRWIQHLDRKSKIGKKIIAISGQVKNELMEDYGAESTVIPCGIDTRHFSPPAEKHELRRNLGISTNRLTGLYVGRWAWDQKGLDRLTALIKNRSDIQWLIVPDVQVELKGLKNAIVANGISYDRLPEFYAAADFSVQFSRYESFGFSTVESLACGTPVIATPTGIAPEIYRSEPILKTLLLPGPLGTVEEMVKAANRGIDDLAASKISAGTCREVILRNYSLEAWRAQMRSFVENFAGGEA